MSTELCLDSRRDNPAMLTASSPSRAVPLWCHSAFYRFVPLARPQQVVDRLRELCEHLTGSVLVAPEGVNGVVAGTPEAVAAFEAGLGHDPQLDGAFASMPFKRSWGQTAPFARMKVHLKPEIVAFGVEGATGVAPGPTLVAPERWRDLIDRDDVVLIDNRNSFEYRLGHFRGAVDLGVNNFHEFAQQVRQRVATWRERHTTVAMYCTGGIRCEKATAWMQAQGLTVLQLDGGILNHFQRVPADAHRDWQGECFVFDNRVALDTQLQETATTPELVYRPDRPDEAWRLARAQRLAAAVSVPAAA